LTTKIHTNKFSETNWMYEYTGIKTLFFLQKSSCSITTRKNWLYSRKGRYLRRGITEVLEELWRDKNLAAAPLVREDVLQEVVDVTHCHSLVYHTARVNKRRNRSA